MNKTARRRMALELAGQQFRSARRMRTAGEVRFIKDNSSGPDWGWNNTGPSERTIGKSFQYNADYLEPLSQTLRSSYAALGYMMSAYTSFTHINSSTISPDGNLGGKGYVMAIKDLRRSLMNAIEAVSAITDTLHDEIHAPHWQMVDLSKVEEKDIRETLQEVMKIRQDPEGWADENAEETQEEASNEA